MCGLSGVVAPKGVDETTYAIFEQMMLMSLTRGRDSTGFSTQSFDGNSIRTLRVLGDPIEAFYTKEYKEVVERVKNQKTKSVFGHVRAATMGRVTLENAHPFLIKENGKVLSFAHNGTLDTYQPFRRDLWQKYISDSEYMAHCIFEEGYEKALSNIIGPAACLWQENGYFYMYHNKSRPLAFMMDRKGILYVNSELRVLKLINQRFGLKVKEKEIYELKHDSVWQVEVTDKNTLSFSSIPIDQPEQKKSWKYEAEYGEDRWPKYKKDIVVVGEATPVETHKAAALPRIAYSGVTEISIGGKTLKLNDSIEVNPYEAIPTSYGKENIKSFCVTCTHTKWEEYPDVDFQFYTSQFEKAILQDHNKVFKGTISYIREIEPKTPGSPKVLVTLSNIQRVMEAA